MLVAWCLSGDAFRLTVLISLTHLVKKSSDAHLTEENDRSTINP